MVATETHITAKHSKPIYPQLSLVLTKRYGQRQKSFGKSALRGKIDHYLRSIRAAAPFLVRVKMAQSPSKSLSITNSLRKGISKVTLGQASLDGSGDDEPEIVENTAGEDSGTLEALKVAVYNFFHNKKGESLKGICKGWGLRSSGAKELLVCRCTVYALEKSKQDTYGAVATYCEKNDGCSGMLSFGRATAKKWIEQPATLAEMKEVCDWDSDEGTARSKSVSKKITKRAPFTLDETARLFVLLQDDKDSREAFRKTKDSLDSAAKLDANFDRFAGWRTVIEPKFNDDSYCPYKHFDGFGFLNEVDSTRAAVEHRSGDMLRSEVYKLRGKFSDAYAGWCHSGQNEVENFPDYVKTGGDFNTVSMQLIIIFEVCNVGTPLQDHNLLDLLGRKLPQSEYHGYESKVPLDDVVNAFGSCPKPGTPFCNKQSREAQARSKGAALGATSEAAKARFGRDT